MASGAASLGGRDDRPGDAGLDDDLLAYLDAARSPRAGRRGRLRRWLSASVPVLTLLGVLLVLLVVFLFHRIVIIVPAGHAGVLYRLFQGGTIIDYAFPEGIHLIAPYNSMTIYDARVQIVLHQLNVLTNKGLPITLDLAVRFHPEYELVGLLHQSVGADYVGKVVVPQVESVLRRHIGQHDPEDVYTNKEGILTAIIKRAIEETSQKFVTIDDIIIRAVHLPAPIEAAISQKLVHQQQAAAYEYRLAAEREEAARKRIEAAGIKDYQKIIAETLDERLLRWQGIQATQEIARSDNAKVVVVGNGEHGLPIILSGP